MTSGHLAYISPTCGGAVQGNDMTTEQVSKSPVSIKSMFIKKFAEELDVEERHCVILRHIHGLSVGEIAEVLNCSERLVESLLGGVILKLRSRMKEGSLALQRMTPASIN